MVVGTDKRARDKVVCNALTLDEQVLMAAGDFAKGLVFEPQLRSAVVEHERAARLQGYAAGRVPEAAAAAGWRTSHLERVSFHLQRVPFGCTHGLQDVVVQDLRNPGRASVSRHWRDPELAHQLSSPTGCIDISCEVVRNMRNASVPQR
jgi:hypothetical protein